MKKIFYVSMIVAFIGSFAVARGTTLAASSNAAMINVCLCSSAPIGVGGDAHIVQGIWHGVSRRAITPLQRAQSGALQRPEPVAK